MTNQHAEQTKDLKFIKRLDLMNRDIQRIILIDDDPDSFKGFEANTLQIKPFEDIRDKSDSILLDLIPLLQGMVHDGCQDFRRTLDDLGTRYAEEAVVEYQMRLARAKEHQRRIRNQGLGGLIRELSLEHVEETPTVRSLIPSPSALVGGVTPHSGASAKGSLLSSKSKENAPAVQKKKGFLFEWLERAERDREEYDKVRMEKMNQIHSRRLEEKQRREKRSQETEMLQAN